jgi:hypothetical protein
MSPLLEDNSIGTAIVLNTHGVLIVSTHHPMDQPPGSSGPSEVVKGAGYAAEDFGYYGYSQAEVSSFPANSYLRLRFLRGNYAVVQTSIGYVLIVGASDVYGFVHFN